MTLEEIKRNAPEGATGYMDLVRTIVYFGRSHGDVMFYHKTKDAWYLYSGTFGYDRIKPL